MLKYNDIISKLTIDQKIRILAGVGNISGKDMKILGIPTVSVAKIKNCMRDVYPDSTSLAHSWSRGLVEQVAKAKLSVMAADGVNLAVMPGPRIKFSPFRKEMTEDPYLASELSGAYMKAAEKQGMMAMSSGYYLTESDTDWMDVEPDTRVLNEYMVSPFISASVNCSKFAVMTDKRELPEAYSSTFDMFKDSILDKGGILVCEKASDEQTVEFISEGIVCLKASANSLRNAVTRYQKLRSKFEAGKDVTVSQIEEECASYKAISEDTLNIALDNVFELIFACAEVSNVPVLTDNERDNLAVRSVIESSVLLENKGNILPLRRRQKIIIVGGIAYTKDGNESLASKVADGLRASGYESVTARKGYDLKNYGFIDEETLALCKKSDVIIFFAGMGLDAERRMHKSEKMTLPPNQLLFADKLAKMGKRVVTVLISEHAPDIGFADKFDGLLLIPSEVDCTYITLLGILMGHYSPSGRLAYSLYRDSEKRMKKAMAYMRRYQMKAGPFIGYRYYDTAEIGEIGYPFGYGLSYTTFEYSKLSINGNTVTFTVKNKGSKAGVETAQVYIGHSASAVLRPRRELCGFAKVSLAAGESKRVSITFDVPAVFVDGRYVVERGLYILSVGASIDDIRLTGKYKTEGEELTGDGKLLSDHLQSHSNIKSGNFTLEANYKNMKKTVKNILFGLGSLALAVGLAIFNSTTGKMSLFLGIVAGILAVCSILFFIIEGVERSRDHKADRKRIKEANQAYFKDAEQVPVLSTEKMFKDEFDVEKQDIHADDHLFDHYGFDNSYDEQIDEKFMIKELVAEFNRFAEERGYKLGRGVAENLFASFTTSRLLVFSGLSSADFNSIVTLLCEYFESPTFVDDAKATDSDDGAEENAFFSFDSQWDRKSKNILNALHIASNVPARVQIAAIDGIDSQNAGEWLEPFMRYVRHPKTRNDIKIFDGQGKNYGYNIGKNLWFAVNLAEGARLDDLSVNILKCATLVRMTFVRCEASDEPVAHHGLSAPQADYIALKESAKHTIPEEIWKRVDRLEKYAADHTDYSIGNKLWRDLERYMGILLSCGYDLSDAIDVAVAVKLLPSICADLKGKLNKEDKTVWQTVEFIFGEENVQYSKTVIDSINTRVESAQRVAVEETETIDDTVSEAVSEEDTAITE